MRGWITVLSWVCGCFAFAAVAGEGASDSAAAVLESFRLSWVAQPAVKGAEGVFPHPACPAVVAVATANGVWLSQDAGREWKTLPGTGPERVGKIRHVVFLPGDTGTCYLATEKGVWKAAGECVQIGSKATGMAADRAWRISLYPNGRGSTLLVTHHDAAPGISRTEDFGKTWQVIAPDYLARDLIFSRRYHDHVSDYTPLLIAAQSKASKVLNIWSAQTVGDLWTDEMRDLIEVEGTADVLGRDQTFWATADKGLLRTSGSFNQFERIGPDDVDEWAGVGTALGPQPGEQIVFAYDPYEQGVLLSADGFATWQPRNDGLRLGKYIKSGSQVRVSADGRVFYAVINGGLQIARAAGTRFGLRDVTVTPQAWVLPGQAYDEARNRLSECEKRLSDTSRDLLPMVRELNAARDEMRKLVPLELQISARLDVQTQKPERVWVDGTALGCEANNPLYDDGMHGDGAAGDGVYGGILSLRPDYLTQGVYYGTKNSRKRSAPLNGVQPLPVHAVNASGEGDHAQSVFPVFTARGSLEFVLPDRPETRVPVAAGEWSSMVHAPWGEPDITGYYAVSFYLRAERPLRGEIRLALRDRPENAMPAASGEVGLLGGHYLSGGASEISDDYVRVLIPLDRFRSEDSAFQPALLRTLVFSGTAAEGNTLLLRDVRFYATQADVPAEEGK